MNNLTYQIKETRQNVINRLSIVNTSLRLTNYKTKFSSIDEDEYADNTSELREDLLRKQELLNNKLKYIN